MTEGYAEAGWGRDEIIEAAEMLNTPQTVYLFRNEYWNHRMLRCAVESEIGRLEEEIYSGREMREEPAGSDS